MWQGSAAEYRHERDNEIVRLECLSKRKDCCKDARGGVVDAHPSRGRYAEMEQEHDRLEDRACELRIKLSDLRTEIANKVLATRQSTIDPKEGNG
jgi:hypothetical protein